MLHPSLNGIWHMWPLLPGTPFWLHFVRIIDLEFWDACDQSGSLDKVDGQVYLEGGSLRLLPNGMLQRKSRSSEETTTFVRMPENRVFSSAAGVLRSFHGEEGEDARRETHPTEDDDMPTGMATQTSVVAHYYCVCGLPLFDTFDGIWHRDRMWYRGRARTKPPKSMKHLRVCGTTITDAYGHRYTGDICDGGVLRFADGALERDDTGGVFFLSPRHLFSFKKSLEHGGRFSNQGDLSPFCARACEKDANQGRSTSASSSSQTWGEQRQFPDQPLPRPKDRDISFPDQEKTRTIHDLDSYLPLEEVANMTGDDADSDTDERASICSGDD